MEDGRRYEVKSRREFLKEAAAGALVLGSQSTLGLAGALNQPRPSARSQIVRAHDDAVSDPQGQFNEKHVLALLDRAMAAYTRRDKPVEAWRRTVQPGQVVGLKINCAGGKGIPTHPVLIDAVAERLQQAGIRPGDIIVWDLTVKWMETAGFSIKTDPNHIRYLAGDLVDYDDQPFACGPVKIRLNRLLTRECSMVINMPVLKEHHMTGVTFSMKNLYGAVERPEDLHGGNGNPAIADLHAIPVVRKKAWFTVGDALAGQYEGGPQFRPEHIWHPKALIIGEDRVALDTVAWQMLEQKRAEVGLPTLQAAGKPPLFIATAADSAHQLGTNDPKRINLMDI
jgi:uncharacterized protein (DUF362 family)